MTRMRSQIPSSSGISEDTMITPFPSLARSRIIWYISYFAPTSMPRVGSSSSSTSGLVRSQRPMMTFCWLPPESDRICVDCPGVLMCIACMAQSVSCRIFLSLRQMPPIR